MTLLWCLHPVTALTKKDKGIHDGGWDVRTYILDIGAAPSSSFGVTASAAAAKVIRAGAGTERNGSEEGR